jgi:hypothetical protein
MDFMQQIANNLNRIQTMNNAMMREGMSRAQAGRRYGPGATRFRTPDGGVGYVYKYMSFSTIYLIKKNKNCSISVVHSSNLNIHL